MKTKLLLTTILLAGMSLPSIHAEDNMGEITFKVFPKYDTTLRKGSKTNYGTNEQIEIKFDSPNDGKNPFVGVMSFEMPELAGKKISKVTYHIVTQKTNNIKTIGLYAYPYDFDNSTVWNDDEAITNQVTEQIGTDDNWKDPIQDFPLNGGTSTISIWQETNQEKQNIESWNNDIDITDNLQKFIYNDGKSLNILLFQKSGTAALFCSADRAKKPDFSDKSDAQNWIKELSGDDYIPYLEVTFVNEEDYLFSLPEADTYLRENFTQNDFSKSVKLDIKIENDNHFVGLMSFKPEIPENKQVKSATLHLVTERFKYEDPSVSIYAYPYDFAETDKWDDQNENVLEALETKTISFSPKGEFDKALTANGERDQASVDKHSIYEWTNEIDITDVWNDLKTEKGVWNILLTNNNSKQVCFFTKEISSEDLAAGNKWVEDLEADYFKPYIILEFEDKPAPVEIEGRIDVIENGFTLTFSADIEEREGEITVTSENVAKEDMPKVNYDIVDNVLTVTLVNPLPATYLVTVPAGFVKVGDNGINKAIENKEIVVHYKEKKGEIALLEDQNGFTVTYTETISKGEEEITIVADDVDEEDMPKVNPVINDKVLTVTLVGETPGEYTITIPKGYLKVGDYFINEKIEETITIEEEVIIPSEPEEKEDYEIEETPAEGQEDKDDAVIDHLHISWDVDAEVAKHEDADKDDLIITATPIVQTKAEAEAIKLNSEITTDNRLKIDVTTLVAGVYNIYVPKGYVTIGDNAVNKEISYEFTSTRGSQEPTEDGDDKTGGIAGISADANGGYTVYNLQGMKVLSTSDASEVKGLKKGLYIVNGKKVVLGK